MPAEYYITINPGIKVITGVRPDGKSAEDVMTVFPPDALEDGGQLLTLGQAMAMRGELSTHPDVSSGRSIVSMVRRTTASVLASQ